MKKVIQFFSLLTILLITSSLKITYSQSTDFPPIQSYLEKVQGKKFVTVGVFEKEKMISQKMESNSITSIFERSNGVRNMTIYSNLDFRKLLRVSTSYVRETKKIIHLNFVFEYKITYTGYNEKGEQRYTGTEALVQCYIRTKDEKKIMSIIKTWQSQK